MHCFAIISVLIGQILNLEDDDQKGCNCFHRLHKGVLQGENFVGKKKTFFILLQYL